MPKRKFYGTNLLVDEKTKELKKIESLDGGWTTKYLDKSTGEQWLKYTVDPDRGYYFNLMLTTPKLETSELICLCLNTEFDDEAHAAAYRLNIEEQFENKEYRIELLNSIKERLTSELTAEQKNGLAIAIRSSQLQDQVNSRELVGKSIQEVEEDAKYFRKIANEADLILKKLEE